MKNKTSSSIILVAVILFTVFSAVTLTGYAETRNVEVIIGFAAQPDAELIKQYGGEIHYTYSIISAIYATLPETAIEPLSKKPEIAYIDWNGKIEVSGQTTYWGIDRINAPQAWSQSTGDGVKIAILDTGVGPHQNLKVYGGYNFVNNSTDWNDGHGHGTMVAGIIAASSTSTSLSGVAPNAQIYSVKILDNNGEGTVSRAIQGIEWAVSNNMQIISMSWSINAAPALHEAIQQAYNSGILLVAAAGNTYHMEVTCPAYYAEVIAVSATNKDNILTEFSSVGKEIELAAPGELIYSTYLNNGFGVGNGTSMAAAFVTGTAALVWAKNPELTNVEVRSILQNTALDLDEAGRDIYYGYGLVDAYAALLATPSPIEADFTWSPATIYAGETVTFDASKSFSQRGNITKYTWNFGDGSNSTLNTPITTHTYASEGNFHVTLTLSDELGFRNSIAKNVTVLQNTGSSSSSSNNSSPTTPSPDENQQKEPPPTEKPENNDEPATPSPPENTPPTKEEEPFLLWIIGIIVALTATVAVAVVLWLKRK